MAEQVKPLSLTEVAYLNLIARLRDEAIARAKAEYANGFAVLCRQHGIADGARVTIEPAMGPVPARLVYDAPDIPGAPDVTGALPDGQEQSG